MDTLAWLANTAEGNRLGELAAHTVTVHRTLMPWWSFPLEPWHWFFKIVSHTPHSFYSLGVHLLIALLLALKMSRRRWRVFAAVTLTALMTLAGGNQAMVVLVAHIPHGVGWVVPPGLRLADLHCHTQASGGVMMPEDAVRWHLAKGYSVLAITDSNKTYGVELARQFAERERLPMVLLGGEEYRGTTHLLMLGLTTPIRADQVPLPEAVAQARAQGAMVLAAHAWTGKSSRDELIGFGIQGFEVVNTQNVGDPATLQACHAGLAMTGNLDFRNGLGGAHSATVLPLWADSPERVLEALGKGECAALYCPAWSQNGAWDSFYKNILELYKDGAHLLLPGLLLWVVVAYKARPLLARIPADPRPGRALLFIIGLAALTGTMAAWSVWWKFKLGWFPRVELPILIWAVTCPLCWRLCLGISRPCYTS